jgi:hypothetical protein
MSIQTARAGLISWLLENVCIRHALCLCSFVGPGGSPLQGRSITQDNKEFTVELQ